MRNLNVFDWSHRENWTDALIVGLFWSALGAAIIFGMITFLIVYCA